MPEEDEAANSMCAKKRSQPTWARRIQAAIRSGRTWLKAWTFLPALVGVNPTLLPLLPSHSAAAISSQHLRNTPAAQAPPSLRWHIDSALAGSCVQARSSSPGCFVVCPGDGRGALREDPPLVARGVADPHGAAEERLSPLGAAGCNSPGDVGRQLDAHTGRVAGSVGQMPARRRRGEELRLRGNDGVTW